MPSDHSRSLRCKVRARLPSYLGDFYIYFYEAIDTSLKVARQEHYALVYGDCFRSSSLHQPQSPDETDVDRQIRGCISRESESTAKEKEFRQVLVRLHSECFTGETLHSLRCDCGDQLQQAMQLMAAEQSGVIIYLRQEGRGIGLEDKLKAYNLQDMGYDTVTANELLNHLADARSYNVGAGILRDLNIVSCRLLTNNPDKMEQLEKSGIEVVERVPLVCSVLNDISSSYPVHRASAGRKTLQSADELMFYLKTKVHRMRHLIDFHPATVNHEVHASTESVSFEAEEDEYQSGSDQPYSNSATDSDMNQESDEELERRESELKNQLTNVSFEQLLAVRHKMEMDDEPDKVVAISRDHARTADEMKKKVQKRANKNRPMEVTSKRPVSRYREVVEVVKNKTRDPRFEETAGPLNRDLFERSYGFIGEYRQEEMNMLQMECKKTKDPEEKQRLRELLAKMKNQERNKKTAETQQKFKREWRKKELEKVKQGKKPFYLKHSEQKKSLINQKVEKLKKEGQQQAVDRMIAKKSKKLAQKERKRMPARRMA